MESKLNASTEHAFKAGFDTSKILSDESLRLAIILTQGTVIGPMALAGIVFNIINIIIFIKLGFTDNITISLLPLPVADLGATVSTVGVSVGYNIWINNLLTHINMRHALYVVAGNSKAMFTKISSTVTAYISIERCMSVLLPLKFNKVVIRPVTLTVSASPFSSTLVCTSNCNTVLPKFIDDLNSTIVSLHYRHEETSKNYENGMYLYQCVLQPCAFVVILIFTIITAFKINQRKKWRDKHVVYKTKSESKAINRNQRVIKMVVILCFTYITCYAPAIGQLIAVFLCKGYSVEGQYRNIFALNMALCGILDTFNATISIVYYYKMSSKFFTVFGKTMPCLPFLKYT